MTTGPVFALLVLVAPLVAGATNVAIDSVGNVWRTGQDAFVLTTANAFQKTAVSSTCATQQLSPFDQPTAVPCDHAYVIKQDASGNVLYATYLGGSSQDGGIAIATDAQDNVYVAGYTYSPDFPVTAGVVQTKNAGPTQPIVVLEALGPFGPMAVLPGGDVFVAKFASDGTLVFSTLLGGSGSDVPALIAADASGSVYVAGTTSSTDFPVTPGALSESPGGCFFTRLNATATALTYSTYSDPTIQALAINDQGDAYLTGFSQPSAGSGGPYVTAIDTSSAQVLYTTFLPDVKAHISGSGAAAAVNASGGVYIGVSPAPQPSNLLVPAPPVFPLGPSFLLQLSADGGSILTETDIDNTQFDSVLLDDEGNAYAFGHGTGTLPAAALSPLLAQPCSSAGGSFVVESSPAGDVAAATYLRQGSDPAVRITAAGRLLVYRGPSGAMPQANLTNITTATVDLTSQPALNFGCLANLGSGAVGAGLAPGEIFVTFGYGIGPTTGVGAVPDASGQFPTSVGGVQVLINGTPVPMLFAQAGEIHGVAPFALPDPPAVEVLYNNQSAPLLDAPWTEVNPGIFLVGSQAAILNEDATVNTPANPAKLGSVVSIYGTGTGYLESTIPDGQETPIPPPYIVLEDPPNVTFAGVAGTVVWAGSAPGLIAGVTQINVRLPASLPAGTALAAVPVVIESPGVPSLPAPISVTP